jgi:hypothetical protein
MAGMRSVRRVPGLNTAGLAFGLLAAAGVPGLAEANSIRVTPAAALDGSRFGLELKLEDPAAREPTDAYVAIGPEKGVRDEASLEVGLTLDPGGLVAAGRRKPGALSFMRLADTGGPGRPGLVVFLEQAPVKGWFIGAWSWDDDAGRFVLAGRAPLRFETTRGVAVAAIRPRVEVEWAAASDLAGRARGYVRILSVAADGERALLLENTELNNAAQRVGHVELGVRAAEHAPGVSGRLLLDNFEINRTSPPLP